MSVARKNSVAEKRSPQAKPKSREARFGRDAWLTAARAALIDEGVGGLEVGKLARKMRATRGSFYWFFESRDELLNCVVIDWELNNTAKFRSVLRDTGANGKEEFQALCDMWVSESGYSPQWDAAMREWARISPRVEAVVRRVDEMRISIIQRIFKDMGYDEPVALVRARITYFHQVGYYTLGVSESRAQRLQLLPIYIDILSGKS
jgi:AcrR family transcriptional regulator